MTYGPGIIGKDDRTGNWSPPASESTSAEVSRVGGDSLPGSVRIPVGKYRSIDPNQDDSSTEVTSDEVEVQVVEDKTLDPRSTIPTQGNSFSPPLGDIFNDDYRHDIFCSQIYHAGMPFLYS